MTPRYDGPRRGLSGGLLLIIAVIVAVLVIALAVL